jgi:hypothetical protein
MTVLLKDLIALLPTTVDKLDVTYVGAKAPNDFISINSPTLKYIEDLRVERIYTKSTPRELGVLLGTPDDYVNALAEDADKPAPSTMIGSIEEADEEADADPEPIKVPAAEEKSMSTRIVEMHKEGKTYKEIAAETGLSYGTVWAMCNKAKKEEKA